MRATLFLLCCALLAGCGTRQKAQVAERVTRDTLQLSNVTYDSVYVYRDRYVREFDISTSLLNMSMSQPEHVLQHKEARKYR